MTHSDKQLENTASEIIDEITELIDSLQEIDESDYPDLIGFIPIPSWGRPFGKLKKAAKETPAIIVRAAINKAIKLREKFDKDENVSVTGFSVNLGTTGASVTLNFDFKDHSPQSATLSVT